MPCRGASDACITLEAMNWNLPPGHPTNQSRSQHKETSLPLPDEFRGADVYIQEATPWRSDKRADVSYLTERHGSQRPGAQWPANNMATPRERSLPSARAASRPME